MFSITSFLTKTVTTLCVLALTLSSSPLVFAGGGSDGDGGSDSDSGTDSSAASGQDQGYGFGGYDGSSGGYAESAGGLGTGTGPSDAGSTGGSSVGGAYGADGPAAGNSFGGTSSGGIGGSYGPDGPAAGNDFGGGPSSGIGGSFGPDGPAAGNDFGGTAGTGGIGGNGQGVPDDGSREAGLAGVFSSRHDDNTGRFSISSVQSTIDAVLGVAAPASYFGLEVDESTASAVPGIPSYADSYFSNFSLDTAISTNNDSRNPNDFSGPNSSYSGAAPTSATVDGVGPNATTFSDQNGNVVAVDNDTGIGSVYGTDGRVQGYLSANEVAEAISNGSFSRGTTATVDSRNPNDFNGPNSSYSGTAPTFSSLASIGQNATFSTYADQNNNTVTVDTATGIGYVMDQNNNVQSYLSPTEVAEAISNGSLSRSSSAVAEDESIASTISNAISTAVNATINGVTNSARSAVNAIASLFSTAPTEVATPLDDESFDARVPQAPTEVTPTEVATPLDDESFDARVPQAPTETASTPASTGVPEGFTVGPVDENGVSTVTDQNGRFAGLVTADGRFVGLGAVVGPDTPSTNPTTETASTPTNNPSTGFSFEQTDANGTPTGNTISVDANGIGTVTDQQGNVVGQLSLEATSREYGLAPGRSTDGISPAVASPEETGRTNSPSTPSQPSTPATPNTSPTTDTTPTSPQSRPSVTQAVTSFFSNFFSSITGLFGRTDVAPENPYTDFSNIHSSSTNQR